MRVLDQYGWIAARFAGVREESGGRYAVADCPLKCHTQARLRFWVGGKGNLLFTCWAGCAKLEILRAVGAGWRDCYPGDTDWKAVRQAVTACYRYRDESWTILYECVRLEPGRGGRDKDFRQRRRKPDGGWDWSLGDVRRVLYRLPELLEADPYRPLLVVAGEKDVDSLRDIGVLATTNVCGERAEWLESYSHSLAGRNIVVVPDRDGPGKRHADEVCGSLLDHAATVRKATLPDKDATAFLYRLRREGVSDIKQLRLRLWDALSAAPQWVAVEASL